MQIKTIYLFLECLTSHSGEWVRTVQITRETELSFGTVIKAGEKLNNAGFIDRIDTGRGWKYKILPPTLFDLSVLKRMI